MFENDEISLVQMNYQQEQQDIDELSLWRTTNCQSSKFIGFSILKQFSHFILNIILSQLYLNCNH